MGLVDRVLDNIDERAEKVINGGVNSIPSPFTRFTKHFVGVEQKKMYVVTARNKVGKTTFASYVFIYNSLLYAYEHPDQVRVKIFYYAWEESPEEVLQRFMRFYLNRHTRGEVRLSQENLGSTDNNALDKKIRDLLKQEEYRKIWDFFESHIVFSSSSNPTGVWKEMIRYADDNGTIHRKKIKIKDEFGVNREIDKFDYYTPDDPNEYRIIFIDHIGEINTEQGLSLKESIDKLCKYLVDLRNDYGFTSVILQQQSTASESTDAFKLGKVGASKNTVADSTYTINKCNIAIGLNSPFDRKEKSWNGYDITILKDWFRYAEMLVNRNGSPGGLLPLFYDGKVNDWAEMPKIEDNVGIQQVYEYIHSLENTSHTFMTISKRFKSVASNYFKDYICRLFRIKRKDSKCQIS